MNQQDNEASSPYQISLIGGGHAHLHIIANAEKLRAEGLTLTLIDPGDFWYSGMASGLLGGKYKPEELRVDLAALCKSCGVKYIKTKAVAILESGQVSLASGETTSFNAVSVNTGSEVPTLTGQPEAEGHSVDAIKPIGSIGELGERLESCDRVAVVGGGPTAVEIAGNAYRRIARSGRKPEVTLVTRDDELLTSWPNELRVAAGKNLQKQGIELRFNREASFKDGKFQLGERALNVDAVIVAAGLTPPRWLETLQPGAGEYGLRVDTNLRVRGWKGVPLFAIGDSAAIIGHARPRLGVFGVRAAPVLLNNLLALRDGGEESQYLPQENWLSLLNMGDGRALGWRGKRWWHGRLALMVKNYLDRKFMRKYQRLY